jgi:iron complex transport system substrate-binding protein
MKAAGLTNFQKQPGWHPLPLERLAEERPSMAAAAFFGGQMNAENYWSSARHPIIRRTMATVPVAALEGATTACGGWFVMDAVEVLASTGRQVTP